jgi:hypothetical protein
VKSMPHAPVESASHAAISSVPQVETSAGPLRDISTLFANTSQDAVLIGIAGVAAVLWVGSFIFLSLPQMRSRYPVRVAAGLSFLQSVFVFALAAIVVPTTALRVLAVLWCVYYFFIVIVQSVGHGLWVRLTARAKFTFAWVPLEGGVKPEGADAAAQDVMHDLIGRATAWQLSLLHLLVFFAIAIWPTKYCVAVVGIFLIWQGSRFVRSALLDHLMLKPPVTSKPSPRVDLEGLFRKLRLGWLLRIRFVQRRIEEYKARHPIADTSTEGGSNG